MGELLDQLKIEVKNLAKYIGITEVHHSNPSNNPPKEEHSGLEQDIGKGLKNLGEFFELTPRKEEPHHSEPYSKPAKEDITYGGHIGKRGDISQVQTGKQPRHLYGEFEKPPRTGDENRYLNRVQSPLYVDRETPVMAYRNGVFGGKEYEP